jgi:RND family efflux transporter MFP subunit|tara:strand:- start:22515 stop:23723 length:1209 start_codon:yes stop_codon:yes gene_type:complete
VKDKLIAIGVVSAALFLAVVMNLLKPDAVKAPEPEAAMAVKTEVVNSARLEMRVESQGIVAPRTRTTLISEVSGAVLDVSDAFVVGGTFKTGDMLLTLDPTDYQVALQRAEAKLISFKALMELEKARSVQAEKEWGMTGRPKSEAPLLALRKPYLLEAQANLLQAEAEVRQAKVKLAKTIIKAPYAGMVSKKLADIGQFVTTGTRIGETFAIDFVEIRLPLTEKDLTMMEGLSSKATLAGTDVILSGTVDGMNSSWPAVIERSEGVVDQLNRSQYIVARVPDPYGVNRTAVKGQTASTESTDKKQAPLRVGTFVKASIQGKVLNDVFKIPRSALLEGSRVGLVDENSLLQIISVIVVSTDDDHYYISEGLVNGQEVIISALGTPIEGLKLRVRNNLSVGGAK